MGAYACSCAEATAGVGAVTVSQHMHCWAAVFSCDANSRFFTHTQREREGDVYVFLVYLRGTALTFADVSSFIGHIAHSGVRASSWISPAVFSSAQRSCEIAIPIHSMHSPLQDVPDRRARSRVALLCSMFSCIGPTFQWMDSPMLLTLALPRDDWMIIN